MNVFYRHLPLFSALLLCCVCLSGGEAALEGKLKILCAPELSALASAIAAKASALNPGLRLSVEPRDSGSIFSALADGEGSLALVDFKEIPAGAELSARPFAFKGLAVAASESNRVDGLSSQQLESVIDGHIQDWSALGGRQVRINVVIPDDLKEPSAEELPLSTGHSLSCSCPFCAKGRPSGERAPLAPGSSSQAGRLTQDRALSLVAQNEGAVALVDLSHEPFNGVKFLKVDGFAPSLESLLASKYPLANALCVALPKNASPGAAALADLLSGGSFSTLIREKGCLPCPSAKSSP